MTDQVIMNIRKGLGTYVDEKRFVARKGKIPIDPKTGQYAKANDPDTWGTFDRAIDAICEYAHDGVDGIGVELGDSLCGIDIDHCINEKGQVNEMAVDIIETMDSYTEISKSGCGVHILFKGRIPEGLRRKGDLEMYSEGRYFVLTGDVYDF
jgi:putative DNA primase/helicase